MRRRALRSENFVYCQSIVAFYRINESNIRFIGGIMSFDARIKLQLWRS